MFKFIKKINLLAVLGVALLSNFDNVSTQVLATQNMPEAALAENLLVLEGKHTSQAWIRNEFNRDGSRFMGYSLNEGRYFVDGSPYKIKYGLEQKYIGRRNPIIFFNFNPKYDVSSIEEIYFEIEYKEDGGTNYYSHDFEFNYTSRSDNSKYISSVNFSDLKVLNSVKASDMHTMHFIEGNNHLFEATRTVNVNEYTFNADGNYTLNKYKEKKLVRKINDFVFKLPSIGSIEVLRNFYELTGSIETYGSSIQDSSIFDYYNTNDNGGYTTYSNLKSGKLMNREYSHYLILPIGKANELSITYLSAKIRLEDGTLIDPKIPFLDVYEDGVLIPNKKAFKFKKMDGDWITNNAVYFPGDRYYKANAAKITQYNASVDNPEPVILSTGKLHNEGWIEYANLRNSNVLKQNEKVDLYYEFRSNANGLIIDIPDEVTDIEVLFIFEINPYDLNYEAGDPFFINLTDENGNLGIRGKLPEDSDPTRRTLWDRIKGFFANVFGKNGSLNALGTALKIVGIVLAAIILLYVILKVINLVTLIIKAKSNRGS